MRRSIIAGAFSMLALSGSPHAANAAQLTIFTSRALGTVLEVVGPEYERSSGHKLSVVVDLSPTFVRRINAGDDFDLLISPPPAIDGLIAAGKLVADTRTTLVRAATGVAVRAGTPKPDIGSVEALKAALRDARSVGYLPTGGVAQMIERLGLTEVVAPKATVPSSDVVSEMVARGELELGIVVITQILTTPGVELVGPLPPELQFHVVFVGAVGAGSRNAEAARDLLRFLTGPVALPVVRAQGMERP